MSLWDCLDEHQRVFIWYEASLPAVRCSEQRIISEVLDRAAHRDVRIPPDIIVNIESDHVVAQIYGGLFSGNRSEHDADVAKRMRGHCKSIKEDVVIPLREFLKILID